MNSSALEEIKQAFAGVAEATRLKAEQAVRPEEEQRPIQIIAICGSTRFIDEMSLLAWEYEQEGHIVFTPRLLPAGRPGLHGSYAPESHAAEAAGVKELVDRAYFKKIEMSDCVIVYNRDGYIGESTRNEINHAMALGKSVHYIFDTAKPSVEQLDESPSLFHAQALAIVKRHAAKADVNQALVRDIEEELKMASGKSVTTDDSLLLRNVLVFLKEIDRPTWGMREAGGECLVRIKTGETVGVPIELADWIFDQMRKAAPSQRPRGFSEAEGYDCTGSLLDLICRIEERLKAHVAQPPIAPDALPAFLDKQIGFGR